jgi:hypothetical protein
MILVSEVTRSRRLIDALESRAAAIGLAVFVGLAIVFELVIGVSGLGLGRVGGVLLAVLVIAIGIAVLVATLAAGRRKV